MPNPISPNIEGRSSESGKSLVEIVMICMIAGIVMAFSLPAVATSISAYNLRGAANRLAEKLSAARSLSMTKNKNVSFSIRKASGIFGLDFSTPTPDGVPDYPGGPDHTTPSPDGTPDTTDPEDPGTGYYTETLPSSISLESEASSITVTFNSRGELPIGSSAQSIPIENNGKSAIVHINLRGKIWVE